MWRVCIHVYTSLRLLCRAMFCVAVALNCVLWWKHSSGAVPVLTLLYLVALWLGLALPLTALGAYFGYKKQVSKRTSPSIVNWYLVGAHSVA